MRERGNEWPISKRWKKNLNANFLSIHSFWLLVVWAEFRYKMSPKLPDHQSKLAKKESSKKYRFWPNLVNKSVKIWQFWCKNFSAKNKFGFWNFNFILEDAKSWHRVELNWQGHYFSRWWRYGTNFTKLLLASTDNTVHSVIVIMIVIYNST